MKPTLNDLTAFATIAAHCNFRRAADELGVSPSALSHTLRTLERNLGVRLLNRTTRSVSPTEIGKHLLTRLEPVMRDLDFALNEVASFRERPVGTARINAAETAARLLLRHVIPIFRKRYPEVAIDMQTEGRFIDIVKEAF